MAIAASLAAAAPTYGQSGSPASAPAAEPALHVRIEERPYRVDGRTAAELETSMYRNGPDIGDRIAYGETAADFRRQYRLEWTGEECRLTDVRVDLAMTIHLPRWDPPAGVSDELKRDWNTFHTALTRHEHGHRDLGIELGNAIVRTLEGARAPTCTGLGASVEAAVREVVAEYGRKQQAYDEDPRNSPPEIEWPPPSNRPS